MAIASVPATRTHLPDPLVTEATRLLSQSRAIVELIHAVLGRFPAGAAALA